MLLSIRETVRNSKPLKYTLITIISIPFALVGIGSYFAGGQGGSAAEVNGVEISEYQVENTYNQLKRRYQQMFGGNIPEGLLSDESIRQQALDELITNQVIQSTVEDQKFAVGDTTLGRTIRNNPQFQVDGQFDADLYQRTLQTRYSNIAGFEESMRQETAINQFQTGVAATSFQLPSETDFLSSLRRQTRTVDYIRYSVDTAMETIEISDDAVNAYFEDNKEDYKFPQRAKLEFIELKKSDLAEAVDVDDEAVAEHYEQFKNNYIVNPEARDASHILLELEDAGDTEEVAAKTQQLNEIKDRLAAGEAFADLAEEFSDDIGSAQTGGSLGQIQRNSMDPDFEEAVFGLGAVGDVSEVVQSAFGLHLIKLDRLVVGEYSPLEEVKDSIIADIRDREVEPEFVELRVAMEESVASDPESLEVAADESNVEIQTSDWIDQDTTDHAVLSDPRVIAAAFSDDVLVNQYNSDVIELNPGHLVAVRVLEYEEPRPKSIDDVKEEVVATLKRQEAEKQLDELAASAVDELIKGAAATKLAKDSDLASAEMDSVLTRQSTEIDNQVVSEIFSLAKPSPGKTRVKSATLLNGDRIAYALKAVDVPEAAEEGDAESAPQVANPRLGQIEFAAMIASLREKAKVDITE